MSVEEASENGWFVSAAIPLLSDVISQTSDDNFSRLFVAVCKQTKDLNSPLYNSLFGGDNIKSILQGIEQERPLVFPLIISLLPEDFDPFFSLLSLHLAEVSEESCNALLAFFFNDLRSAEEEVFDQLNKVLSAHHYEAWNLQNQQLAVLIADNLSIYNSAIECARTFIRSCDEDSLNFIWSSIVSHVVVDFDKWMELISELSFRIEVLAFGPLIPQLVVRAKSPIIYDILVKIGELIEKYECNNKSDLVEKILSSELYEDCDFVAGFVDLIRRKEFVSESIASISMICDNVTDKNKYAIEAIIDEALNINEDEDTCAISVLQKMIF